MRSSDSETDSDFASHILSPFGSVQSLDPRGSVPSFSIKQGISSASSTNDSDSSLPSEMVSSPSRQCFFQLRPPIRLSLRFALEYTHVFTRRWPETVRNAVQNTSKTDIQSFVPALQLAVTLVRTLHANAVCLHYLLNNVVTTSTEPDPLVRTERQNRWTQQLQAIRYVFVSVTVTLDVIFRDLVAGE